jgi:membrane-bound ClpP family serine protease
MAPGTNIGAATPVQLGGNPLLPPDQKEQKQQGKNGEPADTETRKIVNDAVAYIRSLPCSTAAMPTGLPRPCVPPQAFRPPRR